MIDAMDFKGPGGTASPGFWAMAGCDEPHFRDYLIGHPEAAAEYAALKLSLKDKFEHGQDGYTAAKGEFIAMVMEKARRVK
jgi:hypothetical protein